MKNLDIKSLIERYNDGSISEKERAMLESWYINEISSSKDYSGLEENLAKLDLNFLPIIGSKQSKVIRLWPKVAVAASILAVLSFSLYFYADRPVAKVELTVMQSRDIDPAGNKAYLTLANGERIALTGIANGKVATQGGVQITKTADGQLVYKVAEDPSVAANVVAYNTIQTPNGGRYQIALPDGTQVWMNAASSLKFPSSFGALKERKVELVGEAYFEVAKDKKHPFIVQTAQQEVRVLGTHFNVNSYLDELETRTTLVEGSVKVSGISGVGSKVLSPGQLATLKGSEIRIGDADLDQALSWKNGDFVFVGEDLKTVMRQVARWYDVQVEYQGDVKYSGVVSTISRTKKLSQVLKALQANQGIQFKVEGRRVLVMP